ncbi:MAG TPA: nucleotidyltransferase domain-containing protein [Candidatus Angelobacter sp.]|jgi:predicted nucleotidyltransferase
MKDLELREIVGEISRERNVRGVIVHGSSAQGERDSLSDIDIIAVLASGSARHESRLIRARPVDVYMATVQELNSKLHANDPLNNNFVLNALVSGVIEHDVDGSAASLQEKAWKIRDRGPQKMSADEYVRTRMALQRMLASAEKWTLRSGSSAEAMLLAGFRRTQAMVQAIYLYHRVRRLWTSGLPQMLQSMKEQHRNAYDLWMRYVNSKAEDEQLMLLRSMADIAFPENESADEVFSDPASQK